MGHRLSRIVTRTGDDGTTGLADGSRVGKDSARIEAIGAVDELNSALGVVLTEALDADLVALLTGIQHDLFDVGGELAIPGHAALGEAHVARIEDAVGQHNETLAPLKEFVLPGGTRAAALLHVARTACRRAERALVALAQEAEVSMQARRYLNRLSDLMFVLARTVNQRAGSGDVLWRRDRGTATDR